MSRLMEKASDLVKQIHACMRNVETCEAISEVVKDLPFVFEDNDKIIRMDGVLTPEQMESIREVILQTISSNKVEAEQFLINLTCHGEPPFEEIKEPEVVEEDVKELVQEPEKVVQDEVQEPKKQEKKDFDKDEVKRLYLDEDKTLNEVAEILGTTRSTLYRFVQANGLKKPSKKDAVFRDAKR